MTPNMDALLEIRDLSKHFGPLKAVDGVSFDVRRGEVLGFLGPNGAGKSTTMKMATGFLRPTGGTTRIAGHDVAADPIAAKRAVGYLPEGAPAYPDMTPQSFLEFVGEVRGMSKGERAERIREVVRQVHLEGVMRQQIETLSKGYKRRVGLAQAILHDPPVLIMDEPTDGLDPNQKHEVRALIQSMAATKAIVISTHILEEVEAVCTRAIIITRGKIVFDGTPADLVGRSRTHGAVAMTLEPAAATAARAELAKLGGVEHVEEARGTGGLVELLVLPRAGADGTLADAVIGRARERGWAFHELRVERGRLDEVFRSLTTGTSELRPARAASAAAAPASAPAAGEGESDDDAVAAGERDRGGVA